MTRQIFIVAILASALQLANAQEVEQQTTNPTTTTVSKAKDWFEKVKISGYMQLRNNDIYKTNPDMENPQGDRTYGGYDGFSLRRMRMKISGQIHPRMYFYFQADFAADGKNLGQLRDAYFDYFLDKEGEWRMRGGQSKIPFGFENLQSSQNRLALDRNDPLNSAVKDERDMGIGVHYAPTVIRKRFSELKKLGLKGSGDYGMAYVMFYNGQRGNSIVPDEDKFPHTALRFSYPMQFDNGQFLELGIQGYAGQYVTTTVSDGTRIRQKDGSYEQQQDENGNLIYSSPYDRKWVDQRLAASIIYYPQPFGFQAEYNFGKGPEFGYDAENEIGSIAVENLHGGYAQIMYRIKGKKQELIPFIKGMYYKGGKKFELDARSYDMKELEIGFEWQPITAFEVVAIYTIADRRYEDLSNPINRQAGQLLRLQLQVNY